MSRTRRTPCGSTLGHGESCVEGHLCDNCTEITNLRALLATATSIILEELMPNIGGIVVDFGRLNDFLIAEARASK